MPVRDKILIVVGGVIVLLVVVAFIAYPLFQNDDEPEIVQEAEDLLPENLIPLASDQDRIIPETTTIEPLEQTKQTDERSQRAEIERLTRLFVERFGSYSNFSRFDNITSLEPFMTSSMRQYADSFTETPNDTSLGAGYSGVTTRILSIFVQDYVQDSSATVGFVVQQDTQDGLTSPVESIKRDGRTELIYSNGDWLVDGVYYK